MFSILYLELAIWVLSLGSSEISLVSIRVKSTIDPYAIKNTCISISKFIYAQTLSLDLKRVKLIAECLRNESASVIRIQETWTSIAERTLQHHQVADQENIC